MARKKESSQDPADRNRRNFLQAMAATAAGFQVISGGIDLFAEAAPPTETKPAPSLEGFTQVAEFKEAVASWKVYEDLRTRDGSIVFVSSAGRSRELARSAEASIAEGDYYLGLKLKDIALAPADLLADELLKNGDPDPEIVRSAAPPMASAEKNPRTWTTFVGTKEAYDVTPVYRSGSTRTYHPIQYFPELRKALEKGQLYDGLVGGWMPAVRKIIPDSDNAYWEVILFGEVAPNKNKYIVHTWHRTTRVENNKIVKVVYGHSYPAYPPARQDPQPDEFYRALLAFADYWDDQLREFATTSLPQDAWVDLSKHSFAKELMTRPEGLYPKYGAVDRDYAGSEYDGFQDIFTSAIYTNMEWGRLSTARQYIDNYFAEYVDANGMIDMRGPETAQYGLTLSLLARYFHYTHDRALMLKHRAKIEATAKLLADMHDESLRLPPENPEYGLISGWSESDSCLSETPALYWRPYYANSAFSARGFKDLAVAWTELGYAGVAQSWLKRSQILQRRTIESIEKNIQRDKTPPYIGLYPGTTLTFRESLEKEKPSPQGWPHRPYAELLQADVLPPNLANLVIDCMRAHGATTLGIVANVGQIHDDGREILGFISYGYAQMLLRLDRIEEFVLFLYSHRYHAHTRGSWTAGEVTGITGDSALYCMPAQLTIPLLVRWMLVLEDSDEDRLYLAKGVPTEWVASGKEISIKQAPTRWGKVSFSLQAKSGKVAAIVEFASSKMPKEVHLKIRLPKSMKLNTVTVNGQSVTLGGVHADTAIFATKSVSRFEIAGQVS
ncbi:MAG TPA: Tat pathway signal protein [Terriglobales bacterium]|nr:Tat pathway signal protein [Terriglobales bacterium]